MSEPNAKTSICSRPCQKTALPKEWIIPQKSQPMAKPRISIQTMVGLLSEYKKDEFTSDGISDFLRHNPIQLDSLSPYVFFEKGTYTRNRVFGNDRFEVMVLCWDVGQKTPIHNHEGQSCWVEVVSGKLSFTNYKWLGCSRKERSVHIEEASKVPLAAEGSLNVIDERDAIHRLTNEIAFNEKALSLHIYAKPLLTCAIYDDQEGKCCDRELSYYSVEGNKI